MKISVFDIGGTFIKHSIFNGLELSCTQFIQTNPQLGSENMIQTLIQVLIEENAQSPLDGIGISTRGQVDFSHGVIIFDPPDLFPDYSGTPLCTRIKEGLGNPDIPVIIENDGNCAAIAESAFGASKEYDDSLCLVFGTAVGGGIIHDRKIYRGAAFSAGEFGMMQLFDKEGFPVFYEDCASVTSLVKAASKVNPHLTDGKKILSAWEKEDTGISEVIHEWSLRVAMGLTSLIHIFNPACLVLGGGIMESEKVVDSIHRCTYPMLAPGFEQVKILPAALGNTAGMLGAAYLTMQAMSVDTSSTSP